MVDLQRRTENLREVAAAWRSALAPSGRTYYYQPGIRVPQWSPPAGIDPRLIQCRGQYFKGEAAVTFPAEGVARKIENTNLAPVRERLVPENNSHLEGPVRTMQAGGQEAVKTGGPSHSTISSEGTRGSDSGSAIVFNAFMGLQ